MEDTKIQWHAGFASAMDLELSKNRQDLIYHKEYNLNKKPLEVDLLVIKKEHDVQIENEIGALFRTYNIVEYKSPGDHLDIDTFYKAGAYASLYKAYGDTVNERKADEITVSLVREVKPEGLFQYFKENNIHFTNPYSGIYYIKEEVLFPTQIIVTKELDIKQHVWLKALSSGMKKQQMQELLEKIEAFETKLERELADSVLEVTVKANRAIVEEMRGDERMCQALLEIMEPEIDKIKKAVALEATREGIQKGKREGIQKGKREGIQEGIQRGKREGKREGIKGTVTALRDCGQKDAEIKKSIVRVYGITPEEAETYL